MNKSISKADLLPSPFVYFSDPAKRFNRQGDYSAHVYVVAKNQGEPGILLLHSTKYGNVFGPGGELNPVEFVLQGLLREIDEEVPVLYGEIEKELLSKRVVGMWRRTSKGVHNTFLVECASLDIWEKRREMMKVIENEKAGLNRPDYLESDGGLVWIPLSSIDTIVDSWTTTGKSDGRNNVPTRCFVEALEGEMLNIRGFIVPVLEQLQDLYYLLKSHRDLQRAFNDVTSFYVCFADNEWAVDNGKLVTWRCLCCGKARVLIKKISQSWWVVPLKPLLFCRDCDSRYSKARLTLLQAEEENGGERLSSLAVKPLLTYERRFA